MQKGRVPEIGGGKKKKVESKVVGAPVLLIP